MTEFDQAMDAVRDEMAASHENPAIRLLGEMLTERLQREPEIAGKVLARRDGLGAVYKDMQAKARTRARSGCAVISDEEAMEIMEKVYGLEKAAESPEPAPAARPTAKGEADLLDLDALMG